MPHTREKLLFVDDEELVLRGMKRILQSSENDWEMVFVNSGAEALQVLEQQAFDAIITDIRMPRMNGAELLTAVTQRHPHIIRIALSGYTDRDLMLQCVGVAHQYLTKPCDAQILHAVLQRLTNLVRSRKDEPIRALLARCPLLPSMPNIYSKLVERLKDPNCSLDEVGALVAQDAAISTQILKLANSAYYGLSSKIAHPSEAALFLGLDTVRSLVMASHLLRSETTRMPAGFSVPNLWSHSLACARVSRQIALDLGGSVAQANDAHLAGLLHDIGKLLLAGNLPAEYEAAMQAARDGRSTMLAAEAAAFGADHAELGGYYLGLLGLPVGVVDAVTFHHRPSACHDQDSILLAALHIGNCYSDREKFLHTTAPFNQMDNKFIDRQGLGEKMEKWRQFCLNPAAVR